MLGEAVKRLCRDAGIDCVNLQRIAYVQKALILKKFEFDKGSSQLEPIS